MILPQVEVDHRINKCSFVFYSLLPFDNLHKFIKITYLSDNLVLSTWLII